MFDLIVRNARLADETVTDIAVKDRKIAALGKLFDAQADRVLDLENRWYISAGWIDSHVHCNPSSPIYFDEPDVVGVDGGVTTVIDAGSTGADDIDEFRKIAEKSKTNVRALLNISRIGLITQHELADLKDIDPSLAGTMICKHCGFIVGIKARMSGSVIGENGLKPLEIAKQIQKDNKNLPLMVHFGNAPPLIDDIIHLMGQGDILTHCFHGKPNGILTPEGELRDSMRQALDRGVLLDIGHGNASFSLAVARKAMAKDIFPHTISSDIYCSNRVKGPVYGLAQVMSKFLMLGMPLSQVIACVTTHAADMLRMPEKGRLAVGADADFSMFDVSSEPQTVRDSEGETATCTQNIIPLAAIVAGEVLSTKQGKEIYDFHL